ncbi:hypothetical protein PR202_ga27177 [Eleusine coracana subsp. coracana]|uniref:Uncharacterized protein n=1 Tax=Eleusine coracana subsp. coracana TaxID=191504 RepID=A0AAV5DG52_ELECO|nr:hypothetical protein PR202_ga27177 [Eleusine coracana subsp. coracana]
MIIFLSLAHNHLDGAIPESLAKLAKLPKLQELDLSRSRIALFSGEIPATLHCLDNLTAHLQSFNVPYNNLSGPVPFSFAHNFGPDSFAGNVQLCGFSAASPPLPVAGAIPTFRGEQPWKQVEQQEEACTDHCGQMKQQAAGKDASAAGAGAGGGRCGEKPGSSTAEAKSGGKPVQFDGSLAFTADDLLCATAEIMRKSTYDTVYKATLEDGSLVAVKHPQPHHCLVKDHARSKGSHRRDEHMLMRSSTPASSSQIGQPTDELSDEL